jgi:hypothetical protein
MNPKFAITRLDSGGLIPNYFCTSRCRHCLYACGPERDRQYIDAATTEKNIVKIKELGCRSIHVGGGEPFLNLEGLNMVIEIALSLGVHIEYVETNASWYRDKDSACGILASLKERGLSTLLLSMSPFHNEHIPFFKVKGVVEACEAVGMNLFPWMAEFYPEITALGDGTPHSLSEYEERYGPDYLKRLPSRYWVHFGGRALKTFAGVLGTRPLEEILSTSKGGCQELLDVSHFHMDLFGLYVPGLCSGLAIQRDDLGHPISPERYPFLCTLLDKGVAGLLERAASEYGYKPTGGYLSKCHLCFDLRRYLVMDEGAEPVELQPRRFYDNI